MRLLLLVLLSALAALPSAASAQACDPSDSLICTTFDTLEGGTAGWYSTSALTGARVPGGNPGGYLGIAPGTDGGTSVGYSPVFSLEGAYGGQVTFDAFGTASGGGDGYPYVTFSSGALTLVLDPQWLAERTAPLGAEWVRYSAPLTNLRDGQPWQRVTAGGFAAATETDIRRVLGDYGFDGQIGVELGRTADGSQWPVDDGGLDNVRIAGGALTVTPTPESDVILAGETFGVDVVIGDDDRLADNLFGVSFSLAYEPTQMTFVEFVPAADLADCDGDPSTEDAVTLVTLDSAFGIAIAVSRRADRCDTGASGLVSVGRAVFEAALAVPGTPAVFAVTDPVAVDPSGAAFPIVGGAGSTLILEGLYVWPGDTDASGEVDGGDILPIAARFGETGPVRHPAGYEWAPALATLWPDPTDTPIDANGDGRIDEADVLAVGVNYGRTTGAPLTKTTDPLATLTLQPQPAGAVFDLRVRLAAPASVLGAAAQLTLPDGVAVDATDIGAWLDNGDLLAFDTVRDGRLDVAASRKRGAAPLDAEGDAFVVTLRALVDLPQTVVTLERVALGTVRGASVPAAAEAVELESAVAVAGEAAPDAGFGLAAPSPNPVRGTAQITYRLAESGAVTLAVFDALGREVARLVEGEQAAGTHVARLEASALAPGAYLVRLASGTEAAVRRLTVVR